MAKTHGKTLDGNEAVASVAYRLSEVVAIYPITPSSPMGEFCDEWAAQGRPNLWGQVPDVVEMQSEAGAAGAAHGSLQAGALTTTFTASQGLLLKIPELYKIAGELTAFCMHVTARTLATHALSIFGDHSDVMACRQIGLGLLASASVQEAHDFACIGMASSLRSRVPFLHFFDGFRTSHEVAKIDLLSDDDLRAMIDEKLVRAHRERALNPDRPFIRGTAQNPDTFFQAREACNPFYLACPGHVREVMDLFARQTGRRYRLFDYVGHPEAERVVILMASAAETAHQTVEWMSARGEKVGVVNVRLYRPFSLGDFAEALPPTVRSIAVLDRTKEAGALGEPLYLDVVAALQEAQSEGIARWRPGVRVIGGRYGLSSREFTPAMVKAVLDELARERPKNHFTVGIEDDVTHTSLRCDPNFDIEPEEVSRAVFFGLGSDGTVGANKNSIKIIGEEAGQYAQGYFVYDSKKAGAMTVSHLRFGPQPLRSPYLVRKAKFVACHHFPMLEKVDVLESIVPGGVFLLNAPYSHEEVWDHLPREVQEQILGKKLRFYVIDAYKVAAQTGMGRRINTIMQTCFFAISGVLPREEAMAQIKAAIKKTYQKKGDDVVRRNFDAVDQTLANLHEISLEGRKADGRPRPPVVPPEAPEFVRRVTAAMLLDKGHLLPVSAFPPDGTWPSGTTKWEKRNVAQEIPVWDPKLCIQCNKCSMVCPHAAIRPKYYSPEALQGAPPTFKSTEYKAREAPGMRFTIQVAPEDCTGCGLCVEVCPSKDRANPKHKALDLAPQLPLREAERENYRFFLGLPSPDRKTLRIDVKGSQFLEPLFEYSGACAGCGETPYVKLLTQLFGDRLMLSNATGCSSIYGGNLPTTPYTVNADGRGPVWSNSLFEDPSEFGLGFRLAVDVQRERAAMLLRGLSSRVGEALAEELLRAEPSDEAGIAAQRDRVKALRVRLKEIPDPAARDLELLADFFVPRSIWLLGGDGAFYDIGFGGLDHVLALGRKVNVLVLDTEVYSNTGGQSSKATPMGAAARFAMAGKETAKKDLGLMAMTYGTVYVARVALGARDAQTVTAFREADAYPGASLVIAYCHCIAHGYDLAHGLQQQRLAVDSGIWPLYRFDPRLIAQGKPPLQLDSPPPKISPMEYMKNETRFKMAEVYDPQKFKALLERAEKSVADRAALYQMLAGLSLPAGEKKG